jgi:glucose uptake protein GlcU
MWKVSDALLAFAVITLVVGVVLMLCYVLMDEDEKNEHNAHNLHRATLFLLASIAIGIFVLVFQRIEVAHFVKSML